MVKREVSQTLLSETKKQPINQLPAVWSTEGSTKAEIAIDGKRQSLVVNTIGSFPRVTVPANGNVLIKYKTYPNQRIGVQAIDGGALNGGKQSSDYQANEDGIVDLSFKLSSKPGSHRLVVRTLQGRQIFDFWVGPELPSRVQSQQ